MRFGCYYIYSALSKIGNLLDATYFSVKGIDPRDVIEKRIAHAQPKRIVDLRCGTMTNSLKIASKHPDCKVLGIDSSRNRLKVARKKARSMRLTNVVLKRTNAIQTGFENNSVDVVILGRVLHECNPTLRKRILSEACRILKNEGKLLILEWEANEGFLRKMKFAPMYLLEKLFTWSFSEFYAADKFSYFEDSGLRTSSITHCNYSVVVELQKT